MKVLFIIVVSAIVLTEAGRLRQNSPKLMVYEIREREDGSGPDVQMLKVPGDVLYKTINSLQEPTEEEEEDNGLDVHKLLSALLSKPKVNKKRERQRSMVQALKNLVKKLENQYELDDVIQTNDKSSNDDNDENYWRLPQGVQKVQAKPEKQTNPLVSLPLQIALRGRVEDEDREDDDMSFGDIRTMPPRSRAPGQYEIDYE